MAKNQTAKPKPSGPIYGDTQVRPMADDRSWARSVGTMIAGRAYMDGADQTATEMEAKWGAGRLRLLVGPELREKFDRQRYLFNQAIYHGELEDVRRESNRMTTAWVALDRAAEAAGASKLDPLCWEVVLDDGTVAALVPDYDHARVVQGDGRRVWVLPLDELARILSGLKAVRDAKVVWPGADVVAVRRTIDDPLNAVVDTDRPLDEEIPF